MLRPAAEVDERTQVLNLIDYLAAYDAQRTPSLRDIGEHRLYRLMSADLPDHEAVRIRPGDECWLSVAFVDLPAKPEVPSGVANVLRSRDFDADDEPEIVDAPAEPESEEEGVVARWLDEYTRWEEQAEAARRWIDEVWRPWADDHRRSVKAKRLHRDLFEQRERLAVDRESIELNWGFGRLRWSSPQCRVDHPLVTVPAELALDGAEFIDSRQRPKSPLALSANGLVLKASGRTVRETADGGLLIEGHDFGDAVSGFWGDGLTEYDSFDAWTPAGWPSFVGWRASATRGCCARSATALPRRPNWSGS